MKIFANIFSRRFTCVAQFQGKNGVEQTERYKCNKAFLKNDMLLRTLAFRAYATLIFNLFVLLFQRDEPHSSTSYEDENLMLKVC